MRKLTLLFILLAIGTYGFRMWRTHHNMPFQLFLPADDGGERINPRAFSEIIETPYQENLANQMFTFLVFIDPERLCPVVMEEMSVWVEPREKLGRDVNDLLIFVPSGTRGDDLLARINEHGLDEGNLISFDEEGRERNFSQFGVFKILYSLEAGVQFFEMGNDSEEAFQKLRGKLKAQIEKSQNDIGF